MCRSAHVRRLACNAKDALWLQCEPDRPRTRDRDPAAVRADARRARARGPHRVHPRRRLGPPVQPHEEGCRARPGLRAAGRGGLGRRRRGGGARHQGAHRRPTRPRARATPAPRPGRPAGSVATSPRTSPASAAPPCSSPRSATTPPPRPCSPRTTAAGVECRHVVTSVAPDRHVRRGPRRRRRPPCRGGRHARHRRAHASPTSRSSPRCSGAPTPSSSTPTSTPSVVRWLLYAAQEAGVVAVLDPVSVAKATQVAAVLDGSVRAAHRHAQRRRARGPRRPPGARHRRRRRPGAHASCTPAASSTSGCAAARAAACCPSPRLPRAPRTRHRMPRGIRPAARARRRAGHRGRRRHRRRRLDDRGLRARPARRRTTPSRPRATARSSPPSPARRSTPCAPTSPPPSWRPT